MSNYIKLINNFDALKLMTFRANIDAFIDEVNSDKTNLVDALYTLTEKEMEFRQDRVNKAMIVTSHFPFVKTFEDYDFNYQPRLNKDEILDLLKRMTTLCLWELLELIKPILLYLLE